MGLGIRGRDLREAGSGQDCGFGRKNGGAYGQKGLETGYKATGEVALRRQRSGDALREWGWEGGVGRESPDVRAGGVGDTSMGVPVPRRGSGRRRGQGFS